MSAALFLAGVLIAQALGAMAAPPQNRGSKSVDEVTVWFEAVEQHKPGINDAALRAVTAISVFRFGEVRSRLLARRKAESVESFNRLVHRGALMHLDAAMLLAGIGPADGGSAVGSSRARPRAILTTDGGYKGVDVTDVHWEFGRQLVDLTFPRPEEDAWARRWYVASSAFMANRSLLADLEPHLAKARKLYPSDADILFISGCYFDTIASPRVRPIVESRSLPHGLHVDAPSAPESLRAGEDYFRRAVAARPDFAAARLRRGRALDRLGRYDAAVGELRAVRRLTADPAMTYLATLFEGGVQESLGNVAAARSLYEDAARQFPDAQSPPLALSRLARDSGDRAAALAAIEHVLTRSTGEELADPWWTYHLFVVRDAAAVLRELRRPFIEGDAK